MAKFDWRSALRTGMFVGLGAAIGTAIATKVVLDKVFPEAQQPAPGLPEGVQA